jgi:hypothetical protein
MNDRIGVGDATITLSRASQAPIMKHWPALQKFWEYAMCPYSSPRTSGSEAAWHEQIMGLQSMGIAVELALHFLHFQKPGLEAFRQWLQDNRKDHDEGGDALDSEGLSADDLAFWEKNGYLVLKSAVSRQQCADACAAIWEFLRASPDDPASWYRPHEDRCGLMVRFFNHPALDANRQSARVRKAYEQLYGHNAIYKTIDKISFNPPEHEGFGFAGSPLHWDTSLTQPISFHLQGMLYLTDCGPTDGAFHCVPGFHREIGAWLDSLPPDADPRSFAPQVLNSVLVPAGAGDFLIWHQALPHGATPNNGRLPRMVQYLTYFPQAAEAAKEWR